MIYLKQNTASQEIVLGPFVDSTDGNTPETSLSIANTDIKLWKNGATTLANKNSGGATHISGGIYYAVLDATDTNTLGPLVIFCHPSGSLPVRVECCVLAANVYDSLVGGGDKLQVDVQEWLGSTPDALETSDDVAAAVLNAPIEDYDEAGSVGEAIATAASASGATPEQIADAVWDEALSGHTGSGTAGQRLGRIPNADAGTNGGLPTVDSSNRVAGVSGNVAGSVASVTGNVNGSVGSVTGNVGGTVNGLTSTAQGHVRTALGMSSANMDTQLTTIDGVADAIKAQTDQLTFTESGLVDANIMRINSAEVEGDGTESDKWRGKAG